MTENQTQRLTRWHADNSQPPTFGVGCDMSEYQQTLRILTPPSQPTIQTKA